MSEPGLRRTSCRQAIARPHPFRHDYTDAPGGPAIVDRRWSMIQLTVAVALAGAHAVPWNR
jgi:hypothetical protein